MKDPRQAVFSVSDHLSQDRFIILWINCQAQGKEKIEGAGAW